MSGRLPQGRSEISRQPVIDSCGRDVQNAVLEDGHSIRDPEQGWTMATQDDWPDDGGHNAHGAMDDLIGRPQKPGMSTLMKVMLVLLLICGLICCGCCGGAWFWGSQQDFDMENPDGAREVAREVLKQPVPEDMFVPKGSMSFGFFSFFEMKMGLFEAAGGEGILMIMKMKIPQQEGQEQEIEQAFKGQTAQHSESLIIESSESKTLNVKGIGEVDFLFSKGKQADSNKVFRQIQGGLPSPGGGALFLLQVEESIYDEAAIIEWLTGQAVADPGPDAGQEPEGEPPTDAKQPADDGDAGGTDDGGNNDAEKKDAGTDDGGNNDAEKKDAGTDDGGTDDAGDDQKRDAA